MKKSEININVRLKKTTMENRLKLQHLKITKQISFFSYLKKMKAFPKIHEENDLSRGETGLDE